MGTIANMALGVISVAYTRMLGLHAFGALGIINALAGLISIVMFYGQDTLQQPPFWQKRQAKKTSQKLCRHALFFSAGIPPVGHCHDNATASMPYPCYSLGKYAETGHLARLVLLNIFFASTQRTHFCSIPN